MLLSRKIYDSHTLYIITGIAHTYQVERIIYDAIRATGIETNFKVYLNKNKDGYQGNGYVRIESTEVYNKLIEVDVHGEPIISIPGYLYDDKQVLHLEMLAKRFNANWSTPYMGYIHLAVAHLYEGEHGVVSKDSIVIRNVPAWCTETILYDLFAKYNSTPDTTYPKTKILNSPNNRNAMIRFHTNTHDARFALLVNRKINIEYAGMLATIYCTPCYYTYR